MDDEKKLLVNLMTLFVTFENFLQRYEQFEASMLNDDSPWLDKMPEEVHQEWEKLQACRENVREAKKFFDDYPLPSSLSEKD